MDESAVETFRSRDYASALKAQGVSGSGPPRPTEKLTVIAGMGLSEIVVPVYYIEGRIEDNDFSAFQLLISNYRAGKNAKMGR